MMYEGQVDSSKHLNLFYDDVERHYHVITNFTMVMAKKYLCNECHKSCTRDITHYVNRRVATVWGELRVRSPTFVCPAPNVPNVLEFGHISQTISTLWQTENSFVNIKVVLRLVACS